MPPRPPRRAAGPGAPASLWALAKSTAGLAASPLTLPALSAAALRTAQLTAERIEAFPEHLLALAEGRPAPLPGRRIRRRPATERYLITSDLHRCIAGRLDWPERQGTKELYAEVLDGYADDGWHLVENGDVEDFWMVGGSTQGARYDAESLLAASARPARRRLRRRVATEHLERIVDNNAGIYEVIRDRFAAAGRYHRTVGNHDDVFEDPALAAQLGVQLPGVDVADTILLERATATGTGAGGIGDIAAIVAHGHLTDAWNGPGFAALGRYITWLATGLDDLPGAPRMDGLPNEAMLRRLLAGRASNRLLAVDPRFGGNRTFDSLDEQRLFARLDATRPPGGWPWLLYGHTHFPMLAPLDAAGSPTRYANSGCGVLPRAFTALEWDASDPADPLRLVLWSDGGDGPLRIELVADGDRLVPT